MKNAEWRMKNAERFFCMLHLALRGFFTTLPGGITGE